ncbi:MULTISPECIES: sigma-70 family RNA polymerase sigma factor [Pseudomonas]|uniref:sigma-70 family RNA polymerase sigma factor n=1 Tax=Pseudomonas TaxID=286 RepID=UPI0006B50994|nr:sigma-70 family RNA polymerase sigma factor [Pseudomonas fuscovaginae]KPA98420.1 RNA polymerase sigma factor, sigma-70 family [Pseudomonas fuscovaginae]
MSGADTPHSDYVGGLFRSHYDWLCGRLRRHLDSSASAEDIAADTFVQLLTAADGLSIRQPRALLTTLAQRLMYQLWRRRDLERAYLDALQQDAEVPVPSPEDLAQMLEALERVERLLGGLPDKVKASFLLSRVNGLTYPEIAAELGISQRSVSDYMTRAFSRCLRARLDGGESGVGNAATTGAG